MGVSLAPLKRRVKPRGLESNKRLGIKAMEKRSMPNLHPRLGFLPQCFMGSR